MFMMQSNDSRLIKAAKRTIRAEATLVIVIVVITSWSVYGLYRLAVGGSDPILGISWSKSNEGPQILAKELIRRNDSRSLPISFYQAPTSASEQNHQQLTYLQPNDPKLTDAYRQHTLKMLVANQRKGQQLYGNNNQPQQQSTMTNFNRLHLADQIDDDFRSLRLPTNMDDLLEHQLRQQIMNQANSPPLSQYNRSNHLKLALNLPSLMQLNPKPATAPIITQAESGRLNEAKHRSIVEPSDLVPELDGDKIDNEGADNLVADKQVAESNRDSGESVVVSDDETEIPPPTSHEDTSSVIMDGENSSPDTDGQDQEVSAESDQQSDENSQPNGPSDSADLSGGNGESESDKPSDSVDAADADAETGDDSLKESSHNIDEEVDRMTQPSSGVLSQQDRPEKFDYKSTVQFDDSLGPGVLSATKQTHLRALTEPGNLIASFKEPSTEKGKNKSTPKLEHVDLAVDHNRPIVLNGSVDRPKMKEKNRLQPKDIEDAIVEFVKQKKNSSPLSFPNVTTKGHKDVNRTKTIPRLLKNDKNQDDHSNNNNHRTSRHKRSSPTAPLGVDTIRAPYEIEGFLNTIDLDSFIEQPRVESIRQQSEVMQVNSSELTNKTFNPSLNGSRMNASDEDSINVPILKYDDNKPLEDEAIMYTTEGQNQSLNHKSGRSNDSIVRHDEFQDSRAESASNLDKVLSRRQSVDLGAGAIDPATQYHYLTSNDPALQDMLAQKQLIEAMIQSKLPPPNMVPTREPSNTQSLSPTRAGAVSDVNTAGSLPSVEHGLLLYPSADEEHGHEMSSKKKKKHEKVKEKKKLTVAYKKGGHKKKKHKKEEKKYLKEKKFKGAKKGKKVAKGKGGQGGKKGKKLYKDKGFKKKGFKNVYHKEEFGQKKSYFDEFRDKDFKKKWKKFDDKYNYAQMKKWQAKDVKGAKKMKDHGEKFKKYDKSRWKKEYKKKYGEKKASSKKHKKSYGFR